MARVDLDVLQPQVLILCPNRELATQIMSVFESFNSYLKIKGALIMGGTGVDDNFKALDAGAQFIVGTPGRVYDMMKRYVLKTSKIKSFDSIMFGPAKTGISSPPNSTPAILNTDL